MTWSQSFSAEVTPATRVLVLGSMPGLASLTACEYYAHKRNAFWPIMQALFSIDSASTYAHRVDALLACGVGLWDVYGYCYRPGSLDSAIDTASAELNDFSALLAALPNIQALAFNGAAAYKAFVAAAGKNLPPLQLLRLPSTSPAYAAMSLAEKTQRWHMIKEIIG